MQRRAAGWRRALICGLTLLAVSAGCGASSPAANPPEDPARSDDSSRSAGSTGQRHALLIGINRYRINEDRHSSEREGPRFPDLNGAVNDIELIGEILAERYGLAEKRIVRVTDGAATRDRILTELKRLTERTAEGDAIYIHFSGHGSQVRDFDGDEADGFDETILPHDSRTGEIRDITDDELGRAMDALADRDVLLVLDSCHSGTATRGATVLSRSAGRDPREDLYRRAAADQPKTREVVEAQLGYTLMTGAAEHESALDGPIGGRYYGFFSYLLAKAMERAPADASAREIHEEVLTGYGRFARRLRQFTMPVPQLEAPADRIDRQVLTVAARAQAKPAALPAPRARLAFATVETVQGSGSDTQAFLDAAGFDAAGFDAGNGSLWAIYPQGELSFRPGSALAIGEVAGESEDRALLRILRPVGYKPSVGSRAIPLSSGDASQTRVRFDGVPEAIATGLRERLAKIPDAVEAGEGELAQFVVVGNGDRIEVRGLGGLKTLSSISAANPETAVRHVARVLRHAGTVGALLSLENRASALDLEVAVGASIRGAVGQSNPGVQEYAVRADGQPRTETNSLFVEIEAGADGYVTIANVDAEGQVQLLFPNPISEERGFLPSGAVEGGQRVRIPDSLEPTNRAGFHWDVSPPAGLDTLQVFLSTDRETADQIRTFIGAMNSEGAAVDELARRLATRGLKIIANEPASPDSPDAPQAAPSAPPSAVGDWTSRTVSFVVQGDQS